MTTVTKESALAAVPEGLLVGGRWVPAASGKTFEVRDPATGDVLLVVGPEGGISPAEVEALVAAGARPVRLGPGVLRSSTAGPTAIAVLSAASRWTAVPGR